MVYARPRKTASPFKPPLLGACCAAAIALLAAPAHAGYVRTILGEGQFDSANYASDEIFLYLAGDPGESSNFFSVADNVNAFIVVDDMVLFFNDYNPERPDVNTTNWFDASAGTLTCPAGLFESCAYGNVSDGGDPPPRLDLPFSADLPDPYNAGLVIKAPGGDDGTIGGAGVLDLVLALDGLTFNFSLPFDAGDSTSDINDAIAALLTATTLPPGLAFSLIDGYPVIGGERDFDFDARLSVSCLDASGAPTPCTPETGFDTGAFYSGNVAVPGPAALALFGLGVLGLVALRRR